MIENLWDTHDFAVKMLDWSAARGSRLAHTCRRCDRAFCPFALLSHGVWATDGEGRPLENSVTNRWLSEACPRIISENDDKDRKRLREATGQLDLLPFTNPRSKFSSSFTLASHCQCPTFGEQQVPCRVDSLSIDYGQPITA